ncbi:MAG: SGNH/GDSL hydrolase family protein [Spirochaetales bacterium]|nr:SGNH/GDSL hydrolase family protein [Spirochaetales bacterium]
MIRVRVMRESSRSGRWFILFYFVFLAVLLAVAEGILSLFDPEAVLVRADDQEEVYSFYPNREGRAVSREYSALVKTDHRGLRLCPVARGGPRVLVLGDSFAEGWGVECPASFAGILGQSMQIWNAGIHGGTAPYYVLRHRVFQKQWNYEILIIQIFDNDLDDVDKIYPYIHWQNDAVEKAKPAPLLGFPVLSRFLKELSLYRMLRRAYYKGRGEPQPIKYYKPDRLPPIEVLDQEGALKEFGPLRPIEDLQKAYNGQFLFYDPAALASGVWQRRLHFMESSLKQLMQESHSDSRVLLVYIPAKEVLAPGGIRGLFPGRSSLKELRASNPLYQMLKNLENQRVQLLDGQEVFLNNAEESYFPFDAHLNREGHARLARAIAARLAEPAGASHRGPEI